MDRQPETLSGESSFSDFCGIAEPCYQDSGLDRAYREISSAFSETIKAAFVYGSVARGTDTAHSDIDLMVIGGELNYSVLYAALQDVEDTLHRRISPTFLSLKDWQRKASEKGSFVSKVNALPKIFVFGSEKDLSYQQGARQSRKDRPAQSRAGITK